MWRRSDTSRCRPRSSSHGRPLVCFPQSLNEHGLCAGGAESIEVMFKRIGARLGVECFAFMMSCLVGLRGGGVDTLTP